MTHRVGAKGQVVIPKELARPVGTNLATRSTSGSTMTTAPFAPPNTVGQSGGGFRGSALTSELEREQATDGHEQERNGIGRDAAVRMRNSAFGDRRRIVIEGHADRRPAAHL